jgi:hypothetical protein
MGMFDDLRCRYPLPVEGANELRYQTKDLDCQMDQYEIREDGTLWREDYDVEDQSDPNATGIMRLSGMMTRVNPRWVPVDYLGRIWFYGSFTGDWKDWIEWCADIIDGRVRSVSLVERRDAPKADDAVDPQVSSTGKPPTRVEVSE